MMKCMGPLSGLMQGNILWCLQVICCAPWCTIEGKTRSQHWYLGKCDCIEEAMPMSIAAMWHCMEKKLALPQQAFLGCFIASFALALSLSLQASIGFVAASLLGFAIANIALALSWQASFALALSLQAFLSFAIASLVGFGIYSWHVKLSCLYTNQCIAGLPWIMLLQALLVLSMQAVLAFCSNTLCVALFEATSFHCLMALQASKLWASCNGCGIACMLQLLNRCCFALKPKNVSFCNAHVFLLKQPNKHFWFSIRNISYWCSLQKCNAQHRKIFQ